MSAICRVYEGSAWPTGALAPRAAWAVAALEWVGLPPGARVANLGCGRGLETSPFCVVGLDPSYKLLREGAPGARAQATAQAVPLASESCAGVLAECVLSTLAEWDTALAEAVRVLTRGGWLALADVYARSDEGLNALRAAGGEPAFAGLRTRAEIEAALARAGLDSVDWMDDPTALSTDWGNRLWRCAPGEDPLDRFLRVARARLGYGLWLARKVSGD